MIYLEMLIFARFLVQMLVTNVLQDEMWWNCSVKVIVKLYIYIYI